MIYSGPKAPLGAIEGALRFIFMPLVVPDARETEQEEADTEPVAVEVAEPAAA
jgi:hypothetical protein